MIGLRPRSLATVLLIAGAMAVVRTELQRTAQARLVLTPTSTIAPRPTRMLPTEALPTPTALPPTTTAEIAREIDLRLVKLHEGGWFSGVVLVAHAGEVVFTGSYGLADRAQGRPLTDDTRFYVGQLAEEFTAAAVLILEQEGKLWVHDPVCRYLAYCPDGWKGYSIHQLLATPPSAELPPESSPGYVASDWERVSDRLPSRLESNGAAYLAATTVIEQVSGMSYCEFIQERIFSPLGMADSGCSDPGEQLAQGYAAAWYPVLKASQRVPAGAATGVYSTVGDVWRWEQALLGGRLLDPVTCSRMFTMHTSLDLQPNSYWGYPYLGYSYGWLVGMERTHRLFRAGGHITGYSALHIRYDRDQLTIIVLSNHEYSFSPKDAIAPLFFGTG
ncbi:MAG: beta-lactamase family protein [Anaerolineae bacterium]|nr:beta-lactamase family protein [Anaerolineae bacterium]